jgi:peptide/nickel transport system substrate-binding protein
MDFLQLRRVNGTPGGNLVTAIGTDPASFNRLYSTGFWNTMVTDRLAADLVHFNRLTFELEPALARSWNVSKDGRTYTVHLRRGVRYSDGSPFTADDVLFTFQLLQDPGTGIALSDQVKVDGSFPTITKVDSHTLRLTYPRPVGMGLRSLDSVPIVPKSRLLKHYQQGTLPTAWGPNVNPAEVIGLGPFRLKEYQRGVKVVLERNPFYWKKDAAGKQLPYLESLTFLVIPDRNAEALRFQAGELDLINTLNAENYASLRRSRQASGFTIRDLGADIRMDYLWFNLNAPTASAKPGVDPEKQAIFAKAEFRRAVSHAINRDGINRSVMLGLGTPQYGPISTGNKVWYDPALPRTEYSAVRARTLLAQAGLTDTDQDGVLEYGASRRPFEFSLFTSRGNVAREKTAQILKDDLGRIGLRVNVQLLLPNEIAMRFMNSLDYEAVLFGIVSTDVVPDSQPDLWFSHGTFHFWHPKQSKPGTAWEAETDRLMTQLLRTMDHAERVKTFAQIQRIWAREMPAIPVVIQNILTGWGNHVGNVHPSILMPHVIWNSEELTDTRRKAGVTAGAH